jgi:riboflavin kinase/FMN adenylyltransferase
VEAHLLDFAGDIYGQEIELTFLKKLREERQFPSAAALQAQIAQDVEESKKYEV